MEEEFRKEHERENKQLINDVRNAYKALEEAMLTSELTTVDIAQLRIATTEKIKNLGLRPTDYGRLVCLVIMIIEREKMLDDMERGGF